MLKHNFLNYQNNILITDKMSIVIDYILKKSKSLVVLQAKLLSYKLIEFELKNMYPYIDIKTFSFKNVKNVKDFFNYDVFIFLNSFLFTDKAIDYIFELIKLNKYIIFINDSNYHSGINNILSSLFFLNFFNDDILYMYFVEEYFCVDRKDLLMFLLQIYNCCSINILNYITVNKRNLFFDKKLLKLSKNGVVYFYKYFDLNAKQNSLIRSKRSRSLIDLTYNGDNSNVNLNLIINNVTRTTDLLVLLFSDDFISCFNVESLMRDNLYSIKRVVIFLICFSIIYNVHFR